jgi:hypothetical protein
MFVPFQMREVVFFQFRTMDGAGASARIEPATQEDSTWQK